MKIMKTKLKNLEELKKSKLHYLVIVLVSISLIFFTLKEIGFTLGFVEYCVGCGGYSVVFYIYSISLAITIFLILLITIFFIRGRKR